MLSRERLKRAARHPVAQNVMALGSVQVALVVVPLITLPYLARVLSRSELGLVVFVQTFSFLVALVVEYGFSLSATRDVARAREDPDELARTVAGVVGAKVVLSAFAAAISLLLLPLVPIFSRGPDLLVIGVALGLMQGFLPSWFFLGLERTPVVALVELSTRLISLALIVLVVRGRTDGELVLLIYLLASAGSTLTLTALMYRRVSFARPTRKASMQALRRGRTLFAGTGAVAFYTGANAFLLGLLVPASQVALFASAEKVVRAGNRVLGLTAQAVYPRVSILLGRGSVDRANRLSTLSTGLFVGVAAVAAVVLAVFAPVIIEVVFGPTFDGAADLLRILALLLPFNVFGVTLSTQWLLPRGLDRLVTRVVVGAGVLNTVLVIAATELFGLKGSAWACVAVELFVMIGNLLSVRATRHQDARFREGAGSGISPADRFPL